MDRQEKKAQSQLSADKLSRKMASINQRIIESARGAISKGKTSAGYWAKEKRQIEKLYNEMRSEFKAFVEKKFPEIYKASAADTLKALESLGKPEKKVKPSLKALMFDTVHRFNQGAKDGLKQFEKLFRATQQTLIQDERITKQIAEGILVGNPPKTAARTIQNELEKVMIREGRTLEINGRTYDPGSYSELVARTRGREVQSIGAIETIKSFGVDLVRISSHNTTTELCQEYEGNTYSLTGETEGYPVLDAYPPFHPNCLHVIVPVVKE